MGFFDSFKSSLDEELQKSEDRQSHYRTVKQRKEDHIHELDSQSDSSLLSAMRNTFTSDEDKKEIAQILVRRGYYQKANGRWDRV